MVGIGSRSKHGTHSSRNSRGSASLLTSTIGWGKPHLGWGAELPDSVDVLPYAGVLMTETTQRLRVPGVALRQVPGHLAYLTVHTALGWLSALAVLALPLFPLWSPAAAKLEVVLLRANLAAEPPTFEPRIGIWRAMAYALTSIPVAAIGTLVWIILVASGGLVVQAPFRLLTNQPVVGGASGPSGPVAALLAAALALVVLLATGWLAAIIGRIVSQISTQMLWNRDDILQGQVDDLARRQVIMEQAAAAERTRLERTLHDGAQLHLATTAMHLSMIELALRRVSDPATKSQLAQHLQAARDENERAVDDVRSVASGLRPEAPVSLASTLTHLMDHLPVSATTHINLPSLPADLESSRGLLLIAKEAVTNALRHSGCSSIAISAQEAAGEIVLAIRDDGAGGVDPDRGTGVAGIRSRACSLGGALAIISPVGGPTTIRVTIPTPNKDLA